MAILYSHASLANIDYKNISFDKRAQELFNKGMLNYYGYLYTQAEYDFRQALIYDAYCGMCYWGLALAKKQQSLELGQSFARIGYDEMQKAIRLVSPKHEFQYDMVKAAMSSFSLIPHISEKQLQTQYINNLRTLYQKYKNNKEWREESLALFVDAIAYYNSVNDGGDNMAVKHCGRSLSNQYKQEVLDLLVPVLSNSEYPDHPGLLHNYIHLAERNLQDPLGLIAAQKLPAFSQGEIAHYTHMPNHIYWRRGMYQEAIQANLNAINMDLNYFKHNGVGLNSYYYEYHFLHSHHFLTALGILSNNYEMAISYARAIKNLMDVNRIDNLKEYRDIFFSLEHVVLARFNQWDELLKLQTPAQANELAWLFIDFTRALAYLNLGKQREFKNLLVQIKNKQYPRQNMIDLQTLIATYLTASEMAKENKSLQVIEQLFLKNKIDHIEEKLFVMNPPLWFFPYQLFLSDVAAARSDQKSAIKHHLLFESEYPGSTLGHLH